MRRLRVTAVAATLLAIAAVASSGHADAAPLDGRGSQVFLREGTIYGNEDHQPTAAEESAAGLAPLSANTRRHIEQDVKRLLQQTDRLDRKSEEEARGRLAPSTSRE